MKIWGGGEISSEIQIFRSDQFSLLMYRCLLPSSVTVKMDYEENMENVRYATNNDTPLSVICYSFLWSLLPDKFSNNVQLTTDSWYILIISMFFFARQGLSGPYQMSSKRESDMDLILVERKKNTNKGRSPSNGKLSDFSFYIDSQKSAHRKFKK